MKTDAPLFKNPLFDYTLTVLLLLQFFVIPVFPTAFHGWLFNIVGTLMYINLILIVNIFRSQIAVTVFVLFIADWLLFFFGGHFLGTISAFLSIVLFLCIVTIFIASLATTKNVDRKIIMHAVNGYLLLGVIAAIGFEVIMLHNPEALSFPFHAYDLEGSASRFAEYQYFGLCTLSTLGYGDITPLSFTARSFATMITMSGQMYLAIIIALLVGKFVGQNK